jgi:large subunit ribosomal protein L30e
VDVKRQLNNVMDTGKAVIGSNKTIDSLLHDKPKLVLLSSNCPKKQSETIYYYCSLANIKCVSLPETSIELGSSVGRPHPLSAMAILDQGESSILEL